MKRIFISVVFMLSLLMVTACSNSNNEKNLEGSLESILTKIYQNENLNEDFRTNFVEGLITEQVTQENMAYYLGKNDFQFKEAIASEHTFSTVAYSLVLIRTNPGTDIEKMMKDIKDNVDPQKWVCVGVDPNNVVVDHIGDVVILIMSNNNLQELHNAFLSIKN